jgi:hypothetical protein
MCKFWDSPVDLRSKVSRSLVQLIKSTPATGWIRADQATDTLAAAEILRLRNRIEEVEGKLAEARTAAPPGSKKLSQGKQVYEMGARKTSSSRVTRGSETLKLPITIFKLSKSSL